MKTDKINIPTGTTVEFVRRVRSNAAQLDRGKSIPAKINITFEDPAELLEALTAQRARLSR